MTQMLASVTNPLEAETVIRAGADIIDLKNPHAGALGALPLEQLHAIVEQVGRRRPVSATIGDLPADPTRMTKAIQRTAASGVNYVKVGFFSSVNLQHCLRAIAGISADHAVVAVLFADRNPPLHRLGEFADAGFQGLMLDTADKQQGRLLHHIGLAELGRFVEEVRHLGLFSGLAGSLRLRDVPRLLPLRPDFLGFRGALCVRRNRMAGIESRQVQGIRQALSQQPASEPTQQVAIVNQ